MTHACRSEADLAGLAHSPQFQQQLQAFSSALQSGQLDLRQFGLEAEVGVRGAGVVQVRLRGRGLGRRYGCRCVGVCAGVEGALVWAVVGVWEGWSTTWLWLIVTHSGFWSDKSTHSGLSEVHSMLISGLCVVRIFSSDPSLGVTLMTHLRAVADDCIT